MSETSFRKIVVLIKFAVVAMLLGRAWQHFFWTTPYSAILPIESADSIKILNTQIGYLFLLAAILTIWYNGRQTLNKIILCLIGMVILFLAIAYWSVKSFQILQLIEFAAQASIVWLLVSLYAEQLSLPRFVRLTKIIIVCTFSAHGLYALGFPYPTPAGFIEMTVKILPLSTQGAIYFLAIVGLIDLLLSIGLFFKHTEKLALIYAFLWGLTTALARVIAYFDILSPVTSLHRWLYETMVRIPHAILPLVVLLILVDKQGLTSSK